MSSTLYSIRINLFCTDCGFSFSLHPSYMESEADDSSVGICNGSLGREIMQVVKKNDKHGNKVKVSWLVCVCVCLVDIQLII